MYHLYRSLMPKLGPVFLPSEHDELPPGVAFMVNSIMTIIHYDHEDLSSHSLDPGKPYYPHHRSGLFGTLWHSCECLPGGCPASGVGSFLWH